MPKLSDLQLILLTTANQRENSHLLPVPESVGGAGARLKKTFDALLKRSLISEIETTSLDKVWRGEGDQQFGLVITEAGRAAIASGTGDAGRSPGPASQSAQARAPRAPTKQDRIIELLRRRQGATLKELTEATGWLSHTTRAALTGLRKKGLKIEKFKRGETTCYSVGSDS